MGLTNVQFYVNYSLIILKTGLYTLTILLNCSIVVRIIKINKANKPHGGKKEIVKFLQSD